MTLEELDTQTLPSLDVKTITLPALRPLLRRRSPPTLWFTWRTLPSLYAKGRNARYDLSVTQLLVRVLVYSTRQDHHSALEDLCRLIDRESLERFAQVLLAQWLSGPRTPEMSWVIHSQRLIGGLSSLMEILELLLDDMPEREEDLRDMLDVFWQHELLGPSFLHLLEHHPQEHVVELVRALLAQTRERTMWQTTSPGQIDIVLALLRAELESMELSGGVRQVLVEGETVELRMTDSGRLESRRPDRTRYRISAEQALEATRAHREVWLFVDMFQHISLSWRGMVHAANEQQHRWSQRQWRELFFSGQVISHWSRGLIWAEYNDEDEIIGTFRVSEDASLSDVEDDVYQLSERSQISLVHASLVESHTMDTWGERLADYEIISPINQFSQRACDDWSREELEDFVLEGCHGKKIDREALEHHMWRNVSTGYITYRRKKIFAGHRRLFLTLEFDSYKSEVTRCSVIEHGVTSSFSQLCPPTMPLRDLDDVEIRIVVEHVLAVLR